MTNEGRLNRFKQEKTGSGHFPPALSLHSMTDSCLVRSSLFAFKTYSFGTKRGGAHAAPAILP